MGKIFIRGRKVLVHHRSRSKQEVFKAEDGASQRGMQHLRVCPNCGYTEFTVIPSWWSWLLGQKSRCNKCRFIFKKPFTETVSQRSRKFSRRKR